ncbi:hypothetical protein KAR91_16225 [Candidatus Pacearchaeota archaeon]|nr:hypothetical protein [Candidatus Pacearchaeota archaeon]
MLKGFTKLSSVLSLPKKLIPKKRKLRISKDGLEIAVVKFDKEHGVTISPKDGIFAMDGKTLCFGTMEDKRPTVKIEII